MHDERALRALAAVLFVLMACTATWPGASDAHVSATTTNAPGAPTSSLPETGIRRTATPQQGPFDAEAALAFARRLATEVGPRPAGSAADARARALVADELRGAGWNVVEEPVALPQGGATANVVAWRGPLSATDQAGLRPPRHVVIGAHLDTVEGSPGANDNASGVGVLIALARELADETPGVPVVLVAFGAEEFQPSEPRRHHVGSEQYAARHTRDVVAALSVDMVAHGDVTCICWLELGPDTLAVRLDELAPPSGYEVRVEGDFSDHGPFARRGLPTAFLWTGRDGVHHTPADTADRLHLEDLRRAGTLTLAFVRDLTPAEAAGLRRNAQR